MVENTAAHDVELGSCAVKRRSDADRMLKWRNQCSELKTARFMVDCRSLTHTLHVCMTRTNRTVYMPRPQWFETQKAKRSTLRGTLTACNKDKTRSCHLRWPSAFGSDDFRSVLIYVAWRVLHGISTNTNTPVELLLSGTSWPKHEHWTVACGNYPVALFLAAGSYSTTKNTLVFLSLKYIQGLK